MKAWDALQKAALEYSEAEKLSKKRHEEKISADFQYTCAHEKYCEARSILDDALKAYQNELNK